jgi:hypothetical protein
LSDAALMFMGARPAAAQEWKLDGAIYARLAGIEGTIAVGPVAAGSH